MRTSNNFAGPTVRGDRHADAAVPGAGVRGRRRHVRLHHAPRGRAGRGRRQARRRRSRRQTVIGLAFCGFIIEVTKGFPGDSWAKSLNIGPRSWIYGIALNPFLPELRISLTASHFLEESHLKRNRSDDGQPRPQGVLSPDRHRHPVLPPTPRCPQVW